MLDKESLLDKFTSQTKTVMIESVSDEVKIKKLTIAQRSEVNEVLFGEAKIQKAGKNIEVGVTNYNKAAKIAVSYGLIEPKLTLREIEKLDDTAEGFINEVFNALQEFDEPKK